MEPMRQETQKSRASRKCPRVTLSGAPTICLVPPPAKRHGFSATPSNTEAQFVFKRKALPVGPSVGPAGPQMYLSATLTQLHWVGSLNQSIHSLTPSIGRSVRRADSRMVGRSVDSMVGPAGWLRLPKAQMYLSATLTQLRVPRRMRKNTTGFRKMDGCVGHSKKV